MCRLSPKSRSRVFKWAWGFGANIMSILCRKHYIICVIVRLWLGPPLTGSWRRVRAVLSPCALGPRTWTSGAAWPRVTFVTEAATFVTRDYSVTQGRYSFKYADLSQTLGKASSIFGGIKTRMKVLVLTGLRNFWKNVYPYAWQHVTRSVTNASRDQRFRELHCFKMIWYFLMQG